MGEHEELVNNLSETKVIAERRNKVFNWFKDPYNLSLFLIMLVAIGIRLYFFILTKNQPLWWDELSYGSIAKNFILHTWDNTPLIVGEMHIRPLLFSFIWAFLMLLHFGEVASRFLLVFVPSILSVYFIYLIGKEIYDRGVGLISAAIFAVVWINLFYSSRLLVHMLEILFLTSSLYFFVKSTKEEINFKNFLTSLILLSLATLTRYQDGMVFFIYFIILILGNKLYLNKIKFWYAGIIGILPLGLFFLMNLITQGNILPALFSGDYIKSAAATVPFAFNVLNFIPSFLQIPFFIFFIIGVLYLFLDIILGYNLLSKNPTRRNSFLLILIIIIFNAFFIFYLRSGEDRWFFETLISLTIIAAVGINLCAEYFKKYNNVVAVIFIIAVLLAGSYYELKHADGLINLKKDSYQPMKDAFQWIASNTPSNAVIAGVGIEPYSVYYADRAYQQIPGNNESELALIKNADYLVLHAFVPQPGFLTSYIDSTRNSFEPINAFFLDSNSNQPVVIIYQIVNKTQLTA